MINYIHQNITDIQEGVIAHGVNCQGAMNSGVAKAIRQKWPEVYKAYKRNPTGREMLGTTHIVTIDDCLYVANCYTQEFYGYDQKRYASLDAVSKTLEDVFSFASLHEPLTAASLDVYLPKIGCGRGGLNWEHGVAPIIHNLCEQYRVGAYVCLWRDR